MIAFMKPKPPPSTHAAGREVKRDPKLPTADGDHHHATGNRSTLFCMGAAASLPANISKEQAREIAGERFDEDRFNAKADSLGLVSREAFLDAAAPVDEHTESMRRTRSRSLRPHTEIRADHQISEDAAVSNRNAPAADSADSTAAGADEEQAAAAFWALQAVAPFWTVPLAHGASMPWLRPYERGLLLAIERCNRTSKTPLFLENKEDKLVDTYYSYQSSIVIEAKKLVLDVAMKKRTHEEAMEGLRVELVNCMRFGHTLYLRLTDSACDFKNMFNGDDTFPLALFDRSVVTSLSEYRDKSLWGAEHPLAKVLRAEDLTQGIFQPRFSHKARSEDGTLEGFEVVACTQHPVAEFEGFLKDALPLELMQPILPQPSTVRLKYSHYNQEFPLEVGGTVTWASVDDRFALSFVFKGNFKVRLVKGPMSLCSP